MIYKYYFIQLLFKICWFDNN